MIIRGDDKNMFASMPFEPPKTVTRTDAGKEKKTQESAKEGVAQRSETKSDVPQSMTGPEGRMLEQFMNRKVRLEVDTELHSVIIKIVNRENGEVIKQIPPEELVDLAKKMKNIKGMSLVDKEV